MKPVTERIDPNYIIGLVIAGIAIGLVFWIDPGEPRVSSQPASNQASLEQSRLNTGDPVLNLAGCMANHASDVAKQTAATWIYTQTNNQAMSAEDLRAFGTMRQALLDKCSDLWPEVKATRGSLSETDLNTAMYQVFRADPDVSAAVDRLQQARDLIRRAYVK